MKKFLSLAFISLCVVLPLVAQGDSLDFLRSTGKIYSVVIVIAVIFVGITILLYRLDRKLTKLENQIKNEQ